MKKVIVTGSTRGIGRGLAESLLEQGCAVLIHGRTQAHVDAAVAELRDQYGVDRVLGYACDVREFEALQSLWDGAASDWGVVDIWINNAGIGQWTDKSWAFDPAVPEEIITVNLLGAIYGSMVAVRGMLKQGAGAVYNMEGMGSDGRRDVDLNFYGTSKYGLDYFTQGLAQELKGTPVIVGALRPGMIMTDLVLRQYQGRPADWARAKRIFNIISDRVETVTPWLAEQVLTNRRNGVTIAWLSRWKLFWRFLSAPLSHRNVMEGLEPPGGE